MIAAESEVCPWPSKLNSLVYLLLSGKAFSAFLLVACALDFAIIGNTSVLKTQRVPSHLFQKLIADQLAGRAAFKF